MRKSISEKLRKQIAKRAGYQCEYCLALEQFSYYSFQIEHIISLKHEGSNELDNLAYSCPICNRNKGSDLGTLVGNPPMLTRFFHPREDIWKEHFELDASGEILTHTLVGESTVKMLDLNHPDALIQRKILIGAGLLNLK